MTTTDTTAVPPSPEVDSALSLIALEELGFTTLSTRRSDSLDFRDCSVWCIKAAL